MSFHFLNPIVLAVLSFAYSSPCFARDWHAAPAVVDLKTDATIFAVGDPHADLDRLKALLRKHGLIAARSGSSSESWNAANAVLICTGDLIEKGPAGLELIRFMRALQKQAENGGGRVVVLMGNYEAEFLAGKEKARLEKELLDAKLIPAEVRAGRDAEGIGAWLRDLPFAASINGWFFAHAGNTKGKDRETLQTYLENGVKRDGFQSDVLLAEDSILEARLHPSQWWQPQDASNQDGIDQLRKWIHALGCEHLVIGHQPGRIVFADGSVREPGQMVQRFGGLLFLIDVGMSREIGRSEGALLRIQPEQAASLNLAGEVKVLWSTNAVNAADAR